MKTLLAALFAALGLAGAAHAEVTESTPTGFEIRQVATIAASSDKVFASLTGQVGQWWNSEHSWSGDARNLSIDLTAGCFCEALPGGYVRHMTVVYTDGKSVLHLFGGLGPLQNTGASGHFNWTLTEKDGQTQLVATYDVGGYAKGGLDKWADPVNFVIGEQVARLKRFVETGKAAP